MEDLEFEWDEGNLYELNVQNAHRGIDRQEVESIFKDTMVSIENNRESGAEPRFKAIGLSNQNRYLSVIFAVRDKKIRYVTAWQTSSKGKRR